ncbi:hypothetical protein M9H77_31942 [Catharanthus roseus]|uniref:Uncharacterized protein n=1 Tax=Catharanthus roseus TaxID=4058 RepID=A0ACC0A3C0_CATRO|nr:hypothetical protein M9H77_31942 [Catharanthus roseus]
MEADFWELAEKIADRIKEQSSLDFSVKEQGHKIDSIAAGKELKTAEISAEVRQHSLPQQQLNQQQTSKQQQQQLNQTAEYISRSS